MDRNSLLGMTAGAIFMFGFGIVWLLLGIFRGRSSAAWVKCIVGFAGVILAASIILLGLRANRAPANAITASANDFEINLESNHEIGRRFNVVFGTELVAVFIVVFSLRALGYPDYILCAIALIVGIHFFPLAALFKVPLYYGTGLMGCAIGVLGFFIADVGLRQKMVGLSFGALLWGTAALIVFIGFHAAVTVG
jgi:hypothetical protein